MTSDPDRWEVRVRFAEAEAHLKKKATTKAAPMTKQEADVAQRFFSTPENGNWPASGIQRRMQNSGP